MINTNEILNDTYKITEQLGSGGGGIVYKAYHMRLQKEVAIKLIKEEVKGYINERAETDILKKLKHEGLPQVYDFISDGEDVYTVMEYIDGGSLFDVIVDKGRLSVKQCLAWSKELCSAAAYLHSRKPPIIHSDIKPQNIMITSEGKLCLIDFNISSVFGGGLYTVGSSDGYSPPEQYIARAEMAGRKKVEYVSVADNDATEILCDDDKTEILSQTNIHNEQTELPHISDNTILDARSDVYSIGAVMYSMLTGMKPQNSRKKITPLKKLNENIPDALVYIIEKAMSKDKEKRFSSAADMLDALENINKLDKRYKRMALRQQLAFIFSLILLTASVVSIIAGNRLMKAESADKLTGYISQMNEMSLSENYTDFESVFAAVCEQYPNNAEPHYYKAKMLYHQKEYTAAGEYITAELISKSAVLDEKMQADVYFMTADIFFRQENYIEAAPYYEKAIAYNPDDADIYRDYAISLARLGDSTGAEEIMNIAVEHGLTEDGVFMVMGEIQFIRGEYEQAIESLKSGINLTENADLKQNAYELCSRAYTECYGTENEQMILENIELLKKSLLDIPQQSSGQLREYLAQAYIDCGEVSGKNEYYAQAVSLLKDMKSMGFSTYQTEMNIAVICDRIGDTKTCKELLTEMSQTPEYELYYYIIYIRLAYCEADIQSESDVSERNYAQFDEYYRAAEKAYEAYTENGDSDTEMGRLRQLRSEMVSLGWLD